MRIYYGWTIVAISMVILMLFVGCTSNAFGLFVLPVSQDLNLSRADVNTGLILTVLGGAAASPFIGRLIDVFPVRRVMLVTALLFSAGLVVVGLSHSVWLSALMLVGPVAVGMGGVGTLGAMTIVARWFQAQRGRAIAISMMGMSLGTIFLTPLVGMAIQSFGWRWTLIGLGIGMGAIFLLAIAFLREQPGPNDIEPGSENLMTTPSGAPAAAAIGKPLSTKELLRMPLFWIPALGAAVALSVAQAIAISLVPLAQESGIGLAQAATLMSSMGVMGIAGKFVLVWIGDRVSRSLLLTFMAVATTIVCAMLIFAESYASLMLTAALLGLAVGSISPAIMALLADNVGAASFGSANGISMLMTAFGGAIAMRAGGEIYDRTGGYAAMFAIMTFVCAISVVLFLLCWRMERKRAGKEVGISDRVVEAISPPA